MYQCWKSHAVILKVICHWSLHTKDKEVTVIPHLEKQWHGAVAITVLHLKTVVWGSDYHSSFPENSGMMQSPSQYCPWNQWHEAVNTTVLFPLKTVAWGSDYHSISPINTSCLHKRSSCCWSIGRIIIQKVKLNTSTVKKGIVTEGSDLTLELVQLTMKSQHHTPSHRYKKYIM